MLAWMRGLGNLVRVGVESIGSYGAGLTRHLALSGVPVLEVTGPNPTARRSKGKDDTLDAIEAARAAASGRWVAVAKDRTGAVEAGGTGRSRRRPFRRCPPGTRPGPGLAAHPNAGDQGTPGQDRDLPLLRSMR